jgi:small-conductance mechanosensitive channel
MSPTRSGLDANSNLPRQAAFQFGFFVIHLATMLRTRCLVLLVVLASGIPFSGQTQSPALPDARSVIAYLNQSISWYKHFSVQEQLATEPRDVLFVNENRQLADQIIRLSFDFAKAEAKSLGPEAEEGNKDQTESSIQQHAESLQTMAVQADQRAKEAQAEVDSLKDELNGAKGKRRNSLRAAISEAQSKREIAETSRDTLNTMVEFAGSAGKGAEGNSLREQIDQLERTVPAVDVKNPEPNKGNETRTAAQSASATPSPKEPSGILGLGREIIGLSRKAQSLSEAIQLTDGLADASKELRIPLVNALREGAQRGREIANQPESTDPAVMKQQKAELDKLIAQYKQSSASVLTLSKQRVLLDAYHRSLVDWRNAVRDEYKSTWRDLGVRLGALAALIIVLFLLAELWQRTVFRYVHDTKRRYQFLLIRRIILWFTIATIVAFAFARELGSLATFAGLLTAGVAVALQNVILSIVGYFLLIGKYGIRVGDRVQIAGVTGEVVEIGMVRLHLMELGSGGSDAHATGRIVGFPNSVVFQPMGGVFKQIPGTNYIWHEITLTLAPESDFRAVEDRLLSAVESVYSEYRESIQKQSKHLEKTIGPVAAISLNPQSRLRISNTGLEVVIRYPLEFERASTFDDRITREVLDAIERPPKLNLVGIGAPTVQKAA